jgi:hypothetical protein
MRWVENIWSGHDLRLLRQLVGEPPGFFNGRLVGRSDVRSSREVVLRFDSLGNWTDLSHVLYIQAQWPDSTEEYFFKNVRWNEKKKRNRKKDTTLGWT